MKESEPMLETRLYRCGWIFLFILCVWKIAKKVLFPHFVLSFGILYHFLLPVLAHRVLHSSGSVFDDTCSILISFGFGACRRAV